MLFRERGWKEEGPNMDCLPSLHTIATNQWTMAYYHTLLLIDVGKGKGKALAISRLGL
jgi:hypothetical protein